MGILFCRLDIITRIFTRGGKIKDREGDLLMGGEWEEKDRETETQTEIESCYTSGFEDGNQEMQSPSRR